MYRALDVAKYVLNKCNEYNCPVSNLHLNYILYNLQKEYIIHIDKRGLFEEEVCAWKYGTIIPEVYDVFCGYGGSKIPNCYEIKLDLLEGFYINTHLMEFLMKPVWELEDEIKKHNSAWFKTFNNGKGEYNIIPKELIRKDF